MLITLQDDGVVRIYPSTEDAVRGVEALDAEDTFRMVFDENGERYMIRRLRENQRRWFMVRNGEYVLVPTGTVEVEALLGLIRDAELVEPESLRPWLGEITARLTGASSGPP
jgi:hypothetical protein